VTSLAIHLERILIVGLGSIGRRHLRVVRSILPDVQIAVWRHSGCEELDGTGIDRCVTRVDDALSFRPQMAVIASPASHHIEAALPLAHAGVHLLIEKPLATRSGPVPALLEVCRANGLTVMTGYNLRYLSSLVYFRELLALRRVGDVLSVRCEVGQYLPSWRPGTDYRVSASANAALGGGVLLELSHELDYLRWLFGDVEWVSATLRRQSSLAIDVEDTAHIILGLVPCGDGIPIVASVTLDFIRHDTTRSCTVIGSRGSLRWNAIAGSVEVYEEGAGTWETVFSQPEGSDASYVAEWRSFIASVAHGTPSQSGGEDGLAVVRIIEAARRSSERSAVEMVERPPAAARSA
jgi:Predicted dehydrogenases and related proteins